MKMQKIEKATAAITIILMLTTSWPLILLPNTNAQVTNTVKTYAFIGAVPNPVGVGQEVLLHIGITHDLSTAAEGWTGLTVTVIRPDNTTETLGPFRTDSTGGTGYVYRPTMTGTYYLQTHFPEQTRPSTRLDQPKGTIMKASDSEVLALVVTAEPVEYYPGIPMPSEYWTRPINAQLREWSSIAGSSWMSNEYNDPPESPHVLWKKQLTIGGVAGGDIGVYSMEHGDAYQGKWSSRIIIAGVLIYTHDTNIRPLVYTAIDLRTGKEMWKKTFLDNRTISHGQLFFWDSYNYHGVFAYLWVSVSSGFGASARTNWTAFDVFSGEQRFSVINVPSGTNIYGSKGEIYRYDVNLAAARMTLWNLSALGSWEGSWTPSGGFGGNMYTTLDAAGSTAAARRAWALNISIPEGLPGSVRGVKLGDKVVGSSVSTDAVTVWAFSLKEGQEGRLLYNQTWKPPAAWKEGNISFQLYQSSWIDTNMDENIGLIWIKEERTFYAFNLTTGKYIWKSEKPHYYLDIYGISVRCAYGKVYSVGYAGEVHCWDARNGKLLWIYNATDPYTEFLWGNNWNLDPLFISKGKIYFFHSEHSPINPLFRGAPAVCLDAETGKEVWRVDGLFRKTDWGGQPIMGDSVIAMYNSYDQGIYAIGKGPSAVTVEAPLVAVQQNTPCVIRGKVLDVSPGTQEDTMKLRFPYGVPAVSDSCMGEWMKYVYAQFPLPTNVTGVVVSIDTIDPNHNWIHIGNATSDASGNFAFTFTPTIPGDYKIIATFDGSKSYFGSSAETFMTVTEPAVTPTMPPQLNVNDVIQPIITYLVVGVLAIIIAIAVVGVLLLRKKA
ncbi:MAG: PQQ-binding-like beta-propeller repeat protein [Candidatus Bathyarchaeia archaeon]